MKRNAVFRIVYHRHDETPVARYPKDDAGDDPGHLSTSLDQLVASGHATGGDIEEHVDGIGWCLLTPQED